MIHVRPYEEADFDRLAAIHDLARRNELALAGLEAAFVPLRIAAQREGLFEYELYVAERGGLALGFVALTPEELAWLYVDPAHARQGIGRQLVSFALSRLDEDAAIEVLAGNAPALALYAAFGFHVVETVRGRMPGNERFPVTVHVLKRQPPEQA